MSITGITPGAGNTINYRIVSGGVTSAEFSAALPVGQLTTPNDDLKGTVNRVGGAAAAECLVFVRVSQFISFLGTDLHALWINTVTSDTGFYSLDITNIRQDPENPFNNNLENALAYTPNSADTTYTVIARCDPNTQGQITPTGDQVEFGAAGPINMDVVVSEQAPAPTLSIADVTVGEGDGTATLTITGDSAPSSDITVEFATTDSTATGGADYVATSGTATIPVGSTSVTIDIPIIDDIVDEFAETFTVTLTDPSNAAIADGTATVTIVDNDVPVLSIADAAVGEGDGSVTLTITADIAPVVDVTVNFATADGTAVASLDYVATTGTATIAAGQTTATFNVAVIDDSVSDPAETFEVRLSNPSGEAQIIDGTGVVTIVDNDAPVVSIGDVTLIEGGTATLTITVDPSDHTNAVTAPYSTIDGTATAGSDYVARNTSVIIPPGSASVQVTIVILQDNIDELDETFTVELGSPTGGGGVQAVVTPVISPTQGVATVTIVDDDVPSLSIWDVAVGEGDGSVTLTMTADIAPVVDVTVDFATADGTATAPDDYAATSGAVTIPAGSPSVTIDIPIIDDSEIDPGETFTVALSNPANAAIGDGEAVVTIVDDNAVPDIEVNPPWFVVALRQGQIQSESLTIANSGEAPLFFEIRVRDLTRRAVVGSSSTLGARSSGAESPVFSEAGDKRSSEAPDTQRALKSSGSLLDSPRKSGEPSDSARVAIRTAPSATIRPSAVPLNDLFPGMAVPSPEFEDMADTRDATLEPDEQQPCAGIGNTVWYHFTPDEDMVVQAHTFGSDFDTALAVYTGPDVSSLGLVGCVDDSRGTLLSELVLRLSATETYYFQVGGYRGNSGALTFQMEGPLVPPANDLFPGTSFPAPGFEGAADTAAATLEPGEQQPCGGIANTVWYNYTPSEDMMIRAHTVGSQFDTVVAVYRGTDLPSLEVVSCNDNARASQSEIVFDIVGGETYYFQVGGRNGSSGALVLQVGEFAPVLLNDLFPGAEIPVLPFVDALNTAGATLQAAEPQPCASIGSTVWYYFVAPRDMLVGANTFGSQFDTVVAAYRGDDIASLQVIGCNDDTLATAQSKVVFRVQAEETYYLQVGGYFGQRGTLSFRLDVQWLSAEPTSGRVEPGESLDVQVMFDTTDLAPGGYALEIIVQSDDPDEGTTIVPVILEVTAPSGLLCNGLLATIIGTDGDDILIGTPGYDVIVGLGGGDLILGMGGDDMICGGPGPDIIDGGPGNDWISGGLGADSINGGEEDDTLIGGRGPDLMLGGDGNDLIRGQQGDDQIAGGNGNDVILGNQGNDRLLDGEGSDMIFAGRGDDYIDCGPDDDLVRGGPGSDTAEPSCELQSGVP